MQDKKIVFEQIANQLVKEGFEIVQHDFERPWGGFFVINETQAAAFAARYFPDIQLESLQITQKLSPKILVVSPHKRLSWQYHDRRAEIWRVKTGTVGVVTSLNNEPGPLTVLGEGSLIQLAQGQRHRLVGLDGYGIVAEIWQHTNLEAPSNEEDIYRLQDDFGR
jgi:mannose-6-phosphate isomerase